jgi:hypothetical protein
MTMNKKTIFALSVVFALLISMAADLKAQRFEVIPFAGYQTSARINAYEGYFRINDGINYGMAASFGSNQAYRIELSYGRMASSLTYTLNEVTEMKCDLATTYISIGGVVQINPENMVVPFGKIALGAVYYQPLDSDLEKENVMHFSFASGVKLNLNDHFGFRFQAALHLPVFYEGMLFEEAAPPPEEGMKTKVGGIQGDFTVGTAIRF